MREQRFALPVLSSIIEGNPACLGRIFLQACIHDSNIRTSMATLGKAIAIAAQAHQEQYDKAGALYILHPLRLMLRMSSETEMIAAILHDVV